ncbi:Tn3 family transposase [Streptomyces sp. NPDC096193]|uniref:Tn3 family transposase n=1 Tax=Streptomyces sp. NPDC096193 TaxID=3155821 RepID=UPI00332992B4
MGAALRVAEEMLKYATAIRTRTASTEAILPASPATPSHRTYAAMLEIGRAQKPSFVVRYLRLRDLQREQSALVFVNTLMLQDILGEPEWADLLTLAGRRGLTPLFWSHVRPYDRRNST